MKQATENSVDKMNVRHMKGLRYPDEYFIKYFFKAQLNGHSKKKYIEFGCSNGNNLMLPYQYGNEVIGVDISDQSIAAAEHNFNALNCHSDYHFYHQDMCQFAQQHENLRADVLLLPNIACYITREDFISFMRSLLANNLITSQADFFLRLRSTKDFRYGMGINIAANTYVMPDDIVTGEQGALLVFYEAWDLVEMLQDELGLSEFQVMHVDCQNYQGGQIILNSDIVVWGKVNCG